MPALSSYADRVLTRVLGHDSGNLVGKALIREVLTANRTYFVRTDGNDSNTGLVNNAGGAKLTIQAAYDLIATTLDTASYDVTISVQNAAWTAPLELNRAWFGGGPLNLDFNGGSLTVTGGDAIRINAQQTAQLRIANVTLSTISAGHCLFQAATSNVKFQGGVTFGSCAYNHVNSDTIGSYTLFDNDYTISGGAGFWHVDSGPQTTVSMAFKTITLTGTPAFGVGFVTTETGFIYGQGNTFTGSATGKRFNVQENGVIKTGGTDPATYFPGDSAGTTPSGGQYT
jgi:hypothetical protein